MTEVLPGVENLLKHYCQSMSYEEALAKTKLDLAGLPDVDASIEELRRRHQERVSHCAKLTEIGTARKRDIKEQGWYEGFDEGDVWIDLKERMASSGLAGAVQSIDGSTKEIVASLAEPYVDRDKRLGLVVGNVQSGKTANYSAVIAKALDSGYRFIIVLSGVHNNLRRQTQERLESDLGVIENSKEWFRLTDAEGDFGTAHVGNAGSIVLNNSRILAVVKKNSKRLENILRFIRSLDDRTRQETPFLIIDDESDQATPDGSAKVGDEPTTINRQLREIWSEVRNGSYVGYTATPFANVFMDPNVPETELQELYPRDFIHVMPTPSNYFGAERIFGLQDIADEDQGVLPDVVRDIPADDVTLLVPSKRSIDDFEPEMTGSLESAIRWFIIACAIRRMRGQQQKHSTMLIHTTQRVEPHFATKDMVNRFLQPLKDAALEGDVESFKTVFTEEIGRAVDLDDRSGPAPTWPNVSAEIPNVLRFLRTVVDNGQEIDSERLSYSSEPQTVIVIGGSTLSRGLTLEGLFVSYFTRTSNTYDTLLQMGRWFGYRAGYADLQRIWLSPGLEDDYRFLASVESDLRVEVARMTQAGSTPDQIGVRIRLHPGRLQVTSAAKMKHTEKAEADFEGYRLQTTRFSFADGDTAASNAQAAEALFERISRYKSAGDATLFEDVPLQELTEFFNRYIVHSQHEEVLKDAVDWSCEKLPDKRWNVVVSSGGSGTDVLNVDGVMVKSISRSAIKSVNPAEDKDVNIRALMSQGDIVLDLKKQGGSLSESLNKSDSHPNGSGEGSLRLDTKAQFALRKDRRGADGRGLLVIYPISRYSKASSEARISMDEALRGIDPVLVKERGEESPLPPIIGLAVVAPFDTENKLESRGATIAVKPNPVFTDSEDEEELTVEDTERDYRGGA